MKKFLVFFPFFFTSCIQSTFTYVKKPKPLITINQILKESGLIKNETNAAVVRPVTPSYPLVIPNTNEIKTLNVVTHTIEVPKSSNFTVKLETKNRKYASVYYISTGFVYLSDESNTTQGLFKFQSSDKAGEIRIRLYGSDGVLEKEEHFFIEVR